MTTFDQTHDDSSFADRDPSCNPSCNEVLERLPLHVGGDLESALGARMDEHLDACPSCAAAADRMRAAFGAYFASEHRTAAEELGARSLWPDLRARLHGTPPAAKTPARPPVVTLDTGLHGAANGGVGATNGGVGATNGGVGATNGGVGATNRASEEPDETLEFALQDAGTINERGARGRNLMLVIAPLMAAALVIAVSVSGGMPFMGSPAVEGDLVDGPEANAGDENDSRGARGAAANLLATEDGALQSGSLDSESSTLDVAFDAVSLDEGAAGGTGSGLRHLMPADDAERLIRQPFQVNDLIQDPRAMGTLAGQSTWR